MVRIASFRASVRIAHFVVPLAAAGILFLTEVPVAAQSVGEPYRSNQDQRATQQRPSTSPDNLPDWAEPSAPEGGGKEDGSLQGGVQSKQAPPPGEEPVPVDGGLALLAAAGAGYAVRKLREEKGDEDLP